MPDILGPAATKLYNEMMEDQERDEDHDRIPNVVIHRAAEEPEWRKARRAKAVRAVRLRRLQFAISVTMVIGSVGLTITGHSSWPYIFLWLLIMSMSFMKLHGAEETLATIDPEIPPARVE